MKLENTNAIAYKKLLGKSHTNENFSANNEAIPSSVQLASSQIFGQAIDPDASQGVADGIAELVTLVLKPIGLSSMESPAGEKPGSYPHAFELFYEDDTRLNKQLIPVTFGTSYSPRLFYLDGNNNEINISPLSAHHWIIDSYAGVVWFQSIPNNDTDPGLAPPEEGWKLEAYQYTGQYLDTVVGEGGGGGTSPLPIENTRYKPTDTTLNALDYFASVVPLPDTIKYFLLYGNPTQLGVQHPDGDHYVTQISLKSLSSKYGTAKSKEIVIKNLGIFDKNTYQNERSTIEIKVANDPNSPETNVEFPLNGSYESFYLYTEGETATLLWDGAEWHII